MLRRHWLLRLFVTAHRRAGLVVVELFLLARRRDNSSPSLLPLVRRARCRRMLRRH